MLTKQERELFHTYAGQANEQLKALHDILSDDLEALNNLIQGSSIPPIVV